jgi:2-dehydro-3-deoxygalactonokinase
LVNTEEFFSCDWGTSSFRLRQVRVSTGQVLQERRDASGIRALSSAGQPGSQEARAAEFAAFLRGQLLSMVKQPRAANGALILISGMASSSVGWLELPYTALPVSLDGANLVRRSLTLPIDAQSSARVVLISGVCAPNDIMRGEETEILGLFADSQYSAIAENGVVLLPGTHSKHVRFEQRRITGFRTYMTGELFDVLATHSLLRASVQSAPDKQALSDRDSRLAFLTGVRESGTSGLAASLFQTRVRTVLHKVSPAVNRWFLSGLLIGAELADLREHPLPLLLAAAEPLGSVYLLALQTLGFEERLTVVPPDEMEFASTRGHQVLLQSLFPGNAPPQL